MNTASPFIITFDGPAASGKGTLSRRVAAQLGWPHLDTGLLYRAVGVLLLRAGIDPHNAPEAEKFAQTLPSRFDHLVHDPALREHAASGAAACVAAQPAVRAALLTFQRDFIAQPPGGAAGAVLDGRDTGTVIAPKAPAKFFITASLEVRAQRRFLELQSRGERISEETVRQDMQARDARDTGRAVAPLTPAPDAVIVDTSHLNVEDSLQAVWDALAETAPHLIQPHRTRLS